VFYVLNSARAATRAAQHILILESKEIASQIPDDDAEHGG